MLEDYLDSIKLSDVQLKCAPVDIITSKRFSDWKLNLIAASDEYLFLALGNKIFYYEGQQFTNPIPLTYEHEDQINMIKFGWIGSTPILMTCEDNGDVSVYSIPKINKNPIIITNEESTWSIDFTNSRGLSFETFHSSSVNANKLKKEQENSKNQEYIILGSNSHKVTAFLLDEDQVNKAEGLLDNLQPAFTGSHAHNVPCVAASSSQPHSFVASASIDQSIIIHHISAPNVPLFSCVHPTEWMWHVQWLPLQTIKLLEIPNRPKKPFSHQTILDIRSELSNRFDIRVGTYYSPCFKFLKQVGFMFSDSFSDSPDSSENEPAGDDDYIIDRWAESHLEREMDDDDPEFYNEEDSESFIHDDHPDFQDIPSPDPHSQSYPLSPRNASEYYNENTPAEQWQTADESMNASEQAVQPNPQRSPSPLPDHPRPSDAQPSERNRTYPPSNHTAVSPQRVEYSEEDEEEVEPIVYNELQDHIDRQAFVPWFSEFPPQVQQTIARREVVHDQGQTLRELAIHVLGNIAERVDLAATDIPPNLIRLAMQPPPNQSEGSPNAGGPGSQLPSTPPKKHEFQICKNEELIEPPQDEILICCTFTSLYLLDSKLNFLTGISNFVPFAPTLLPRMASIARLTLIEYVPELSLIIAASQGCRAARLIRIVRFPNGYIELVPLNVLPENLNEVEKAGPITGLACKKFEHALDYLSYFQLIITYGDSHLMKSKLYCYEIKSDPINNDLDVSQMIF